MTEDINFFVEGYIHGVKLYQNEDNIDVKAFC